MDTQSIIDTDSVMSIFNSMYPILGNLYGRWLDEHEYEDFSEYAKVIRDRFESHKFGMFGRATKKPFGFSFMSPDGRLYKITTTAKQAKIARVA